MYISGKRAEEIGFEKFAQRQARLQGIHVLVLDRMRIRHRDVPQEECRAVSELCSEITELDLSDNLFETFEEILELCEPLPKLKVLTLDGNRFIVGDLELVASKLRLKHLSLRRTLLSDGELNSILSIVPTPQTLVLAENEIDIVDFDLPSSIDTLDLSDNHITTLSALRHLATPSHCPRTILLKRNQISTVATHNYPTFTLPVSELDLTYNTIQTFAFFNDLTQATFPALKHLRTTGNALYTSLTSADGKPLKPEDGYMLTLARLPHLETLNYAKITAKERLNAETYYLSQVGVEISLAEVGRRDEVVAKHPRFAELCEEYGEPLVQRKVNAGEVDPNSLAAGLVSVTFMFARGPKSLDGVFPSNGTWTTRIPKSFSIYSVLGMVGKRLGIMPLDLRLVLETDERDPVGKSGGYVEPIWWDSSDDESEDGHQGADGAWIRREVELVAGTRALGTYVDGNEAIIRVGRRR